ncbi:ubiquitin-like [Triplophysa rosa]|uniref:Ubiquitin-like protein n=1 Tax=Triplophysa rosa TaxID=992332 RepID=A0A9W7X3U7_TRIRA|nr:ubiquitin-like [Triplophysa rosa]KAI7813260.1 ubiquitin-like protein [Triplophysa rosa]
MELLVKGFNGNTKRLTVDCNATVGELKKLILQDFINFDNDSRTLRSYGLTSESSLMLLVTNPVKFPVLMQVFVRNEMGITSTYEVDPNETVDQLQREIYNKERVPLDQQRLIYNGRQLESGKKLNDYDITNQSTIHMTLRLRG